MGRIAQQTPNGLQYFLPDALGSARRLSDAAGALALAQSFNPFGGRLPSLGSATTILVALQPYSYTAGNPLRFSDPSGEIIPFLVAADLGGLTGGGIDLGAQLLALHPQNLSQALHCVNWGEVGIAMAGGAGRRVDRFTIFVATTGSLGSRFFAKVTTGTISDIVRLAAGFGSNVGGALEVVTKPNTVDLDFFYMP